MPVRHAPVALRAGFAETTYTYTDEEARAEAARCLDCDRFCSICVGVCPNLAILTYASEPLSIGLPSLRVEGGRVVAGASVPFRVEQRLQVAVLTDFCNECGNCATFCPTAGAPYRDKPRLYLDRADFEAQHDNAFMILGATAIETRAAGETHRVEVNGTVLCAMPRALVSLDPATWDVLEASAAPGAADGEVPLAACGAAYALLVSLRATLPFSAAAGVRRGGGDVREASGVRRSRGSAEGRVVALSAPCGRASPEAGSGGCPLRSSPRLSRLSRHEGAGRGRTRSRPWRGDGATGAPAAVVGAGGRGVDPRRPGRPMRRFVKRLAPAARGAGEGACRNTTWCR